MLVGAAPAVASAASCPSQSSSRLLSGQGDNAQYYELKGSSFEASLSGWTLDNAQIVEDSPANLPTGKALRINPGGSATSPTFCVSSEYPSFRFYARRTGFGWLGHLQVTLRVTNSWGWTSYVPVRGWLDNNNENWALSPVLGLASELPLLGNGTVNVSLIFQSTGATWTIDDVLIDPYSR
jgi:hypothetical protein